MFKLWYKIMCKFETVDKWDDNLNICDIIKGSFGVIGIIAVCLFFTLILLTLIICGIIAPLVYFGYMTFAEPKDINAIYQYAITCYGIVFALSVIAGFTKYQKYADDKRFNKKHIETEPSMVSLAYKSFKEKTCFIVDVRKYK